MSKAKHKVVEVQVLGEVIDRETGAVTPAGRDLTDLAARGWAIKQEQEALEGQLKAVQSALLQALTPGESLRVPGLCQVAVATRETVRITAPEALERVLGPRFADLVDAREEYKPTPKLLALAADGDSPLRDLVNANLAVSSSVVVSWRAA